MFSHFTVFTSEMSTEIIYAGRLFLLILWIVSVMIFIYFFSVDFFHEPLLTTFFIFLHLFLKLQAPSCSKMKFKRQFKEDLDPIPFE